MLNKIVFALIICLLFAGAVSGQTVRLEESLTEDTWNWGATEKSDLNFGQYNTAYPGMNGVDSATIWFKHVFSSVPANAVVDSFYILITAHGGGGNGTPQLRFSPSKRNIAEGSGNDTAGDPSYNEYESGMPWDIGGGIGPGDIYQETYDDFTDAIIAGPGQYKILLTNCGRRIYGREADLSNYGIIGYGINGGVSDNYYAFQLSEYNTVTAVLVYHVFHAAKAPFAFADTAGTDTNRVAVAMTDTNSFMTPTKYYFLNTETGERTDTISVTTFDPVGIRRVDTLSTSFDGTQFFSANLIRHFAVVYFDSSGTDSVISDTFLICSYAGVPDTVNSYDVTDSTLALGIKAAAGINPDSTELLVMINNKILIPSTGRLVDDTSGVAVWRQAGLWADSTTVDSLFPKTNYTVKVKARNALARETDWGEARTYQTLKGSGINLLLSTPSPSAIICSIDTLDLWPALDSVYIASAADTTQITPFITGLEDTVTGLSANTFHSYLAVAHCGDSVYYSYVMNLYTLAADVSIDTIMTCGATKLRAVFDLNINPAGTHVSLFNSTIGKYIDAGGSAVSGETWLSVDSVTVTGLDPATEYSFRLRAKNGDDSVTAQSALVTGTTNSGLTFISDFIDHTRLLGSWADTTHTLSDYFLQADSGGGWFTCCDTSTGQSADTAAGLNPNKLYALKAVRIDPDEVIESNIDSIWTDPDLPSVSNVAPLNDSTAVVFIDNKSNPDYTRICLIDSLRGAKGLDYFAGPDAWHPSPVWRSWAEMGGTSGDTLRYLFDYQYEFRVYAKSDTTEIP